ncbi:hypothetical protein B0H11DRAFT_242973 [Mycena galericulata]|nr:hypothetical protein B0H11DRAFT_242973 [Mycena galericulata]
MRAAVYSPASTPGGDHPTVLIVPLHPSVRRPLSTVRLLLHWMWCGYGCDVGTHIVMSLLSGVVQGVLYGGLCKEELDDSRTAFINARRVTDNQSRDKAAQAPGSAELGSTTLRKEGRVVVCCGSVRRGRNGTLPGGWRWRAGRGEGKHAAHRGLARCDGGRLGRALLRGYAGRGGGAGEAQVPHFPGGDFVTSSVWPARPLVFEIVHAFTLASRRRSAIQRVRMGVVGMWWTEIKFPNESSKPHMYPVAPTVPSILPAAAPSRFRNK